jgi:hypothetical protein
MHQPHPGFFDLNIPTEQTRKNNIELVKKKIQQTQYIPTIFEPNSSNKSSIVRGSPAYAQSLKQRQQALMYNFKNRE